MALGFIFDSPDKLRIEGVSYARNYNSDRQTTLATQAAGQQIGMVIKPGNDLANPHTGLFRNPRLIVDDGRDGLFGDMGGTGDVVHREFRAARHRDEERNDLYIILHVTIPVKKIICRVEEGPKSAGCLWIVRWMDLFAAETFFQG